MRIVIQQSPRFSCPGVSSVTVKLASENKIIAVGFQNDGDAVNFWASQMFPAAPDGHWAYWQLVNQSPTSTDFWVYYTVVYEVESETLVQPPKFEHRVRRLPADA